MMKKRLGKILVLLVIFTGSVLVSKAQEIGLRFGDVSAGNIAIDGIFSTGEFSRIHADVSFGNGLGVDALWDFVYRPLGDEALNWYAGVGPYIQIADPFWFGAVGEIGVDYQFSAIPISLSIDWRPAVSIVEVTDLHAGGFGINVRYVIGK